MDQNALDQQDEIEALSSIFDTEWRIEPEENAYSIEVSSNVKLFITLNSNYPSHAPPKYELLAPVFTPEQKQAVVNEFESIYQEYQGGPVIFQWIEKLKEIANNTNNYSQTITDKNTPEKVIKVAATIVLNNFTNPITHGETIIDRKSVFQGHAAVVNSLEDTKSFLNILLTNKKIKQATHNISAYRITTPKNTILQDCDDDGENHAGGRLLHLLQILNVKNVMVVVSRWYGGIQLGPDRFKHINNAARQVLDEAGLIPQ